MIERIKNIILAFAASVDALVEAREKIKAENSGRYLPDVAAAENEQVEAEYKANIEPLRAKAMAEISHIMQTMRAYIFHGIATVDTAALAELNALEGVELNEEEIKVLTTKYTGKYWPLKVLAARVEKDGTTAKGILQNDTSVKPEPNFYYEAFEEVLSVVSAFVQNYEGAISRTSTNPAAVKAAMLLSGSWFDDIEERINGKNPAYFMCDYPAHFLTDAEQARLEEVFAGVSESMIESRILTLFSNGELAPESELFDIISRSRYSHYLKAVSDKFAGRDPVQFMREARQKERDESEWRKKYSLEERGSF